MLNHFFFFLITWYFVFCPLRLHFDSVRTENIFEVYYYPQTKRQKEKMKTYFRLINLFYFKWIFSSLVFILEIVYKICFLTYFLPSKRTKFSLPSKTYFILKQILSENIEHHYLERLEFCLLNIKLKLKT